MVEQVVSGQNPGSLIPASASTSSFPETKLGQIARSFCAKRSRRRSGVHEHVLATLWRRNTKSSRRARAVEIAASRSRPGAGGACLLTAGVDVQADRLELEIAGGQG